MCLDILVFSHLCCCRLPESHWYIIQRRWEILRLTKGQANLTWYMEEKQWSVNSDSFSEAENMSILRKLEGPCSENDGMKILCSYVFRELRKWVTFFFSKNSPVFLTGLGNVKTRENLRNWMEYIALEKKKAKIYRDVVAQVYYPIYGRVPLGSLLSWMLSLWLFLPETTL